MGPGSGCGEFRSNADLATALDRPIRPVGYRWYRQHRPDDGFSLAAAVSKGGEGHERSGFPAFWFGQPASVNGTVSRD